MILISVIENNARHLKIITEHLQENPNYRLLSTATNGFEFLKFCYSNKQLPDIALIDIEMDVMDGVTLVDFLNQFYPSIKCIAVSSHNHKEIIEAMMACGAMGFVFKLFTIDENLLNPQLLGLTNKFETIDAAIETVIANVFYLDKLIERSEKEMVKHLNRETLLAKCQQQRNANAVFNLTLHEYEILLLCAGSNSKLDEIATLLSKSIQSLKLLLSGIYKKWILQIEQNLFFCVIEKALQKLL